MNVDTNENSDDNYRISNEKTITIKSLAHKTKIVHQIHQLIITP